MTGNEQNKSINLVKPANYRIRVPGHINQPWSDWFEEMSIRFVMDNNDPYTDLIVKLDQAALQGLLRRLYNLGLPIISLENIDITGNQLSSG